MGGRAVQKKARNFNLRKTQFTGKEVNFVYTLDNLIVLYCSINISTNYCEKNTIQG